MLAKQSAEARCRAQLEDWSYTSEKLDQADKRIRLQIVYRPTPAAHGGPLMVTKSDGYATGARLSLPASRQQSVVDAGDDEEVFGIDLQDPAAPPTKDDILAADNDNIGEDPLPADDDSRTDEATAKTPSKKAKSRASPSSKAPVNLDWAPAPRVNNIKKTN